MPKYEINVNNQKYQINTDRELTQEDFEKISSDLTSQRNIDNIKDISKNVANIGYNALRKVGHGATFWQGAHIEGLNEASGGALYNILHGKNPFKDLKQDYISGRERTKEEYEKFAEEHPYINFGSEMLGAVGTGGFLSGIGKTALKSAIPRAMAEGSLYGLGYGASNTKGKGFDPMGAVVGTGLGAGIGAGLSGLGIAGQKFLSKNGGKIKDILKSYKKFFSKNPLLENAENKGYTSFDNGGIKDYAQLKRTIEKAEEAEAKGDILASKLYRDKADKIAENQQFYWKKRKDSEEQKIIEDYVRHLYDKKSRWKNEPELINDLIDKGFNIETTFGRPNYLQAEKDGFSYGLYYKNKDGNLFIPKVVREDKTNEIAQLVEKNRINQPSKVATVGEVAADENIPYHILKTVDDWKVKASNGDKRATELLNETTNKQLPYLNNQYKNILVKDLSEVLPTIKNIGNELYKPFEKATFTVEKEPILNTIKNFRNKEVSARAEEALNKILNKTEKVVSQPTEPEIVNGWQILPKNAGNKVEVEPATMQELREARQKLYDLAEEILSVEDGRTTVNSSLGGREAMNFYNNLRKQLSEQAGKQIQGLRSADKIYSSMLEANSDLVSILGKKLDKGSSLNKILGDLRNKNMPETSNMFNNIEENLNQVSAQFKGTPYENQINKFKSLIENINDNSKLFQISYALQPQEMIQTVGKRINAKRVLKTALDEINNPQKKFYNFVKYAKAGAINEPANKSAFDFGRTTIERKAAQNRLYSKPKKPLYTEKEVNNIKNAFSDLYNSRFANILNRGGLVPKATIRTLLDKYYK